MLVTVEQLESWLKSEEGERLEFKEAKNQYDTTKLHRYCVALSNEGGGKFILGVNDEKPRKVVGSQAFLNLNDIKSKIFDKLHIRVDAEVVEHPDGRVVIFHIPGRPIGSPLHHDGAYLMRIGEDLVPMTPDQLRTIFDEGKPDFLSQIALSNVSAEDVVRLLDTQIYFDLLQAAYPEQRRTVLERFADEGLIIKTDEGYHITNLGAILFAKDLQNFESVKDKAPRVTVYDGKSKQKTKSDTFGRKGYVTGFEGLLDYIYSRLPSNEVIGKAFREEVKMFPEIAVRELVANALIHQDFNEHGMFVTIDIYSDRMEISNPGVSTIDPDRLLDSYQARNEKLADITRRLRICERQGSGIDKVLLEVEAWQLPAPEFRNGDKHFSAILYSQVPFSDMSRKDKIRACYQHCGLKFVVNERMTNQTLRERFDLAEARADVVSGIIKSTLDDGLIRLEDPESTSKRYARYVPFWA